MREPLQDSISCLFRVVDAIPCGDMHHVHRLSVNFRLRMSTCGTGSLLHTGAAYRLSTPHIAYAASYQEPMDDDVPLRLQ
jgi:UDP-N-acetylglucosamine transferase subunit ALG13